MGKKQQTGSRRVTVWDVGRASGVSISTVSNVLNAPDIVAEDTRERVLQAIDELGYIPHAAARNLKSQKAYSIGFPVYKSGQASIMGEFFRELVEIADSKGYGITTFTVTDGRYMDQFQTLLDRQAVDGFLISEVHEGDPRIRWLISKGVRFVAWGRAEIPDPYDWVDLDVEQGMRTLTQHVIDQGHTDIAYVGWDGQPTNRFRKEGVEAALSQSGLKLRRARRLTVDFSVAGGQEAARKLLSGTNPPTAIICGHDIIAAGVIKVATAMGFHIGQDGLIVTGSDDTPIADATLPTLTSVRFPLEEIARNLLDVFVSPESEPQHRLVTPELIVRESST